MTSSCRPTASTLGRRGPFSCLGALVHRLSLTLIASTALVSCGVTEPELREVYALVQLSCDSPTVREFRLLWDGSVVDANTYQASTVAIASLSYDATISTGSHTIGVMIASQTASPNRCVIYGAMTVTDPSGRAGNQFLIPIPSVTQSLATGAVATFAVTVE